ncbi:alcohol dehydrogenase catalytic domain-containing protein [Actinoplanes bogorensis]|uniref:Alcohol dehydrogenase catalytic domain-containing protein n=1 Tax=Paractinoplanes bogorensis TaxID=1610840 RepID=A0ABS5YZM1_9ACTN|nr:alcohol dehydrogenase catalytic domain-containing protein [Actinoplanes bogorensis]MBU2668894.1 alcohol dehydrogenase catalytic domain-containing protein [Actinoplanes bogorensis]
MKSIQLSGARDAALTDFADEPLAAGQVRVRMRRVGLCGSDAHFYDHGQIGRFRLDDGPVVIGHEGSGEVLEVGDGVDGLAVGDRVSIEPGIACGECRECRNGTYNLCVRMTFLGMPPNHGLLRERVVLPARNVHRVPEEVNLDEAALLEPLSVAVWSVQRAQLAAGERVLIAGAGPIGLLVARVAVAEGAAEVIVTDIDRERLDRIGAEPGVKAVDVSGGWDGVPDDLDVFLECSGAPTALDDGMGRLRPRGRAVLVGVPGKPQIAISSTIIRYGELSLTAVHRYAGTWPRAIELLATGKVGLSDLVTARYSLSETPTALLDAAERRVALKAMIEVDAS